MNRIRLQARKLRMAAIALTMLAAIVLSGKRPAQAQTNPISFVSPSTFQAYEPCSNTCPSSQAVAIGDFNGDGKLDEVNIDSFNDVNVVLGNGDGTFGTPSQPVASTTATGLIAYAITVGDFNGDHLLDVAVWGVNNVTGTGVVEIFLGNGAGGFSSNSSYATPVLNNDYNFPTAGLAAADVNGDGRLDIVALASFGQGVFVFLGNGDGSLQTPVNYSVGSVSSGQAMAVAVGDLNGDGKADIAVSYYNGVSVLLNSGGGTFATAVYYDSGVAGGQAYGGLAIGDVNGDGKLDIVETNYKNSIAVFLNQGNGTFAAEGTISVSGIIYAPNNNLLLADINNDKKLDVVAVDFNGDVHTFYGRGNGTFTTAPAYSLGTFYGYNPLVALGDFNHDGALDLLNTATYEMNPYPGTTSETNSVSLGRGDGTFRTAEFFGYGDAGGQNIVSADFNGDSIPDVAYSYVATNVGTQNEDFAVMLGSSHGTFGNPTFARAGSCTGNLTQWIAAGDVNGDGFADVVATLTDSTGTGCQNHKVAVVTGTGAGKFNVPKYYATNATAQEHRVYLGDVNGDGKLDIITENVDGTISVLLNKGNGTYSAGVLITSISSQYGADLDLAIADFNGDGKADIAAMSHIYTDYSEQNFVWVLLSTGNATFSAPFVTSTTNSVDTPVAADFNNDGKMDLVASAVCRYGEGYESLHGNGDGTFTEVASICPIVIEPGPTTAVAGDFNGDGNQDVFITYANNTGSPLLLQGDGTGAFAPTSVTYPGAAEAGAAVADFNGDGMADIAVLTNFNLGLSNGEYVNYVSVLQNATQPVSVSPLNLNYGTVSVGSTKSETVILTNDRTTTLNITSIGISGTNASDFSETSTCGKSRKSGWDCTVTVKFTPGAAGTRSASLNITDSAGTQTVQLHGTGQ